MSNVRLALLGAALCLLSGTPVLADAATLSKQSAIHQGPGNEFDIIGYLDAGRIELERCGPNARQENWCLVDRPVKPGWIHVVVREPVRRGGGAGVLGDSGGGPKALAEDSSTVPGDPKSKRIRASGSGDGKSGGGSEGMSPTDAGSLPGNGGGSRDSGGGGSGSGRPNGSGESAASQHKLAGQ